MKDLHLVDDCDTSTSPAGGIATRERSAIGSGIAHDGLDGVDDAKDREEREEEAQVEPAHHLREGRARRSMPAWGGWDGIDVDAPWAYARLGRATLSTVATLTRLIWQPRR